jgi:hypothetical protein
MPQNYYRLCVYEQFSLKGGSSVYHTRIVRMGLIPFLAPRSCIQRSSQVNTGDRDKSDSARLLVPKMELRIVGEK